MTNFKLLNLYMLRKPETTQSFPFGNDVYVYKVKTKMFATLSLGKISKGDEGKHWC